MFITKIRPVFRTLRGISHRLNSTAPITSVEDVGPVRTILLNNPKKRNALGLQMLEELYQHISASSSMESIKVLVIGHVGPVFSSGHDLKELTPERGSEFHANIFDLCTNVMKLVQDVPIPVIAKVNGLATAAGCQLVATCDIVVATQTSKFATPGVNVGLFCSTPAVAVARAVPQKIAAEMLFTGEPIDADAALRHGLLSRVVPEKELDASVDQLTAKICSYSRSVAAVGKDCLYRQMRMERDAAYKLAGKTMVENLRLLDGQEGITAFVEKRKPVWVKYN